MNDQSGGDIVGVGSYGCVFDKPLKCADKRKSIKKGRIGKITMDFDAEQEVTVANILRKRPIWQNFFVLADPESCKLAPIHEQKEKELDQCEPIFREHSSIPYSEMIQIFFPWGGRQFGDVFYSTNIHPNKFDFYRFMIHMLEAVGTMTLAGVSHFDLHPGNILLDQNGVGRLIDFGMAFNARNITQSTLDNRWKQLAFGDHKKKAHWISNQEAPEITIMNAINHGYSVHDAIESLVYGKDIFKDLSAPLFGIPRATASKKIEEFWKTSVAAHKKDWVSFWKSYWVGFDSWAIGTLFLTVLMKQLSFRSFSESSSWKNKRVPILTAIRGLLDTSPRNRIDAIEALALVDPGNAWLSRFGGGAWLEKKEKQRAELLKI
jgi:hypothetical protein